MNITTYKCTACGSPLFFDGESGQLVCSSCASGYTLDDIEGLEGATEASIGFELAGSSFQENEVATYVCSACGASLLTEETTTATECPYCQSPIVLNQKIASGVRPEKVIPFKVEKKQAVQQFEDYFKGKKLMPNIFLNTKNRIGEIKKLFVPYWLFDCDAWGDAVYDCRKVNISRSGDYEIKRTRYYIAHRSGGMRFENIPVDGSEKLDNKITESLEPYDLSEAVDFQSAILSGALADQADVMAEACKDRAIERVESSMASTLRSTVNGYSDVSVRSQHFTSENGHAVPVLLPVWLITTEKELNGEKKTYTFAINGQTGKLTCDVPAALGKSFAWGFGTFAAAFAVCALILALVDSMTGGAFLISAIISLLIAIIVVCVLRGQLNTAASQSGASQYQLSDTFHLAIHRDMFIRETIDRRKIETNNK